LSWSTAGAPTSRHRGELRQTTGPAAGCPILARALVWSPAADRVVALIASARHQVLAETKKMNARR